MEAFFSAPDIWTLLAPLWVGVAAVLLAMAADAFVGTRSHGALAVVGMLVACVVSAWVGAGWERTVVGNIVVLGGGAAVLAAYIYFLAAVCLMAGHRRIVDEEGGGQLAATIGFTAVSSAVLVSAYDLALVVIALETVALAGYALVASGRTDRAREAAMKYFVQGAVATGLAVYALALVFGLFGGSAQYFDIAIRLQSAVASGPLLTSLALLAATVSFKLGAFPFHSWAPDAYETAPGSAAGALASMPKVAAVVAATVLFGGVFQAQDEVWTILLVALAVASIAFGNLGGLRQLSFQRMLAYSGIAQIGYVLAGFVAVDMAAFPVWVMTMTYALAATGAFLASEALTSADIEWDGSVRGMAGMGTEHPMLALAVATCMLSLTGMPLTAGFWGKFLVFGSIADAGWEWLAVVGVVGSVVSFGYYGNVLKVMYLENPPAKTEEKRDAGSALWSTVLVALLVLVVGIGPIFVGIETLYERLIG
jgi:NADH-quinone oxidoreductase subunit N